MQKAKSRFGRELVVPAEEEDARITAAALSDPDNPPLVDAFFERAAPIGKVFPELARSARAGRPRLAHDSRMVTLRMEGELVDEFKQLAAEQGGAYQALMREALREWIRGRAR